MDEETTQHQASEEELTDSGFVPARFPVEFRLPEADRKLLDDATRNLINHFRRQLIRAHLPAANTARPVGDCGRSARLADVAERHCVVKTFGT